MRGESLHDRLSWFRGAIHDEMPQGRMTDRDVDAGGAPDFTDRMESFVGYIGDEKANAPSSFPVRHHMSLMAKSGTRSRRRAEFLFRLACHDFDVIATARATSKLAVSLDEHGEDWALDYAAECLRRLQDRMRDPELNDTDGKPRRFLPRKSESQYRAEEAA